MRWVRSLASCAFLAAASVPALAQQTTQAPTGSAATAAPAPSPQAAPQTAAPAANGDGRAVDDLTLLGTPLALFRQQLQKPQVSFSLPRGNPVATYRVTVTPGYQAEFVSRFRPMWELSDEERRLSKMSAKGGGLDPMAAVRAYRHVAKSLEARRARKEVALVLQQLRAQAEAERLEAARDQAAKEAAAKEAAAKEAAAKETTAKPVKDPQKKSPPV